MTSTFKSIIEQAGYYFKFRVYEEETELNIEDDHEVVNTEVFVSCLYINAGYANAAAEEKCRELNQKAIEEAEQWLADNVGN